ncbi:MAG: antibiotic biosynthesis monooxygenase [Cyanobacteria bacterium P01_D01_bin.6]
MSVQRGFETTIEPLMMEYTQPFSEPVTLVISEVVKPRAIAAYEEWCRGISLATQQCNGFLGVEIIRPRDAHHPEYVVIVRFRTYEHLRCWLISPSYRAWIKQGSHFFIAKRQGINLWFQLSPLESEGVSALPDPPYYKKVVLGVLAVYPLILLANVLLDPLLTGLPPLLGLFFSVILVSALLTYPVMPYLSKVMNFWLYPKR